MPNGGIRLAEFITKKLGIYEQGTNPVVFPQFGTAKFRLKDALPQLGNIEIETVQTRKEAYRDKESRKPEVCFGTIQEDALRRDLTINAVYLNVTTGETLDITGTSSNDLRNHILRTPNDPRISFEDDALRILRVIRFASTLGWGIEARTWGGMCVNAYRLETISKERITEEFNKIITSENAADGIRRLYLCGALKHIIPEFEALKGLNQGKHHIEDAFDHSLTVMSKMKPQVVNRLAGLLHDIGKTVTKSYGFSCQIHFNNHEKVGAEMVKDILEYLKYPKDIIKKVSLATANHMRFKQSTIPSNSSLRKFANEMKTDEDLDLCLELIEADNTSHAPKSCKVGQVNKIRARLEKMAEQESTLKVTLPLNGKDIMEILGLKKGPQVGAALRLLTEYYYISPKMTKEDAINVLKYAMDKGKL